MDYNQIIPYATSGKTLILPGWHGYFYWNYSTNELNFKDGNYHLDGDQLRNMNIRDRNDWYYIT